MRRVVFWVSLSELNFKRFLIGSEDCKIALLDSVPKAKICDF